MNQPYTYRYPLPFGLPSRLGYHSALGRVPWHGAILQDLLEIINLPDEEKNSVGRREDGTLRWPKSAFSV